MKIGLQNFQGITTYQEIQLKPLTLIYGKNSSGKSTIFDALTVAKSIHKGPASALPAKWISQLEERVPAISKGLDTIIKLSELQANINKFDDWINEGGIISEADGETTLARLIDIIEDTSQKFSCEFHWSSKGGEPELHTYKVEFNNIELLHWTKNNDVNFQQELLRRFSVDRLRSTIGVWSPDFAREVDNPKGLLRINLAHPLTRQLDEISEQDIQYPWVVINDQVHLECDIDKFSGGIDYIISGLFDYDLSAKNPLCIITSFLISGITSILHDYLDATNIPPIRALSQSSETEESTKFLNYLADCHENSILADSEEDREAFKDHLGLINKWLTGKEYLDCRFEISPRTSFALTLDELEIYAKLPDEARVGLLKNTAKIQTEIKVRDVLRNATVALEDVGTGISQVIPVLVGALRGKAYIQQPELHLHPAMQPPLADIFIESINSAPFLSMIYAPPSVFNTFLAIETHSELLALRLLRRIRETSTGKLPKESLALSPDVVSVIYVARKNTGEMTITNLRISHQGDFLDRWPEGFFDERGKELFEEDE